MRESLRAYIRALWSHSKTFASGAIVGAAGIALTIHPLGIPAWVWSLIALASIAWLGFVAFHDLYSRVGSPPKPHLTFSGVDNDQATIVVAIRLVGSSSPVFQHMPVLHDFVRVQVANNPPPGVTGVTALKVYTLVTFREEDGTVALSDMLGRWARRLNAPRPDGSASH